MARLTLRASLISVSVLYFSIFLSAQHVFAATDETTLNKVNTDQRQAEDSFSAPNVVSVFSHSDQLKNQERERLFRLALAEKDNVLKQSQQRVKQEEDKQERLKISFDDNEVSLTQLQVKLEQRTGTLGEVFGVAKEAALELKPMLKDSMTSADNLGRTAQLSFADSKRIPTLLELQFLSSQLQLEMAATGQIKQFETLIVSLDGVEKTQEVIRFGVFSAASMQGDYLAWDVVQQQLTTLSTQPSSSAKSNLLAFFHGEEGAILLDPSRGELFALLDRMPSVADRIKQGGEVGFLIIILGVIGIMVALFQLWRLLQNEIGVKKQLRQLSQLSKNNPLGRVLLSAHNTESSSGETTDDQLELKVDEAILHELPLIEQGQNFLKLLAAVAPLLGLLGTVVGMIITFQSITLFGTSDPKLMANGISQALMTTVLGLVVAIPLLFCHSLLATRGRRLVQVLQEKSLAALANAYASGKIKEERYVA
jgi:biopolymer transport protein ExbB